MSLLLASSLQAATGRARDPDADGSAPPATAALSNEPATLHLSPDRQRLGGIRTVALRSATLNSEQAVQGRIVDISPLLELRTRYRATLAEARIGETTLALAEKNRDRLARLSQESIIATKDLVAAESMLATETTKAATLRHRLQELREEALHSWGPELFRLAIEEDSALWDALLKRQKVLVLIALPANQSLPPGARTIHVARNRDREHAVRADFLSAAPNTDNFVQGETYFFHLDAGRMRTGMRVDAWIPGDGRKVRGAFVPASAIVWYGGIPWVYLQIDQESYRRVAVTDYEEFGDGWFVRSGFQGEGLLVVTGAQLLLSEEMRGQIPREDDD